MNNEYVVDVELYNFEHGMSPFAWMNVAVNTSCSVTSAKFIETVNTIVKGSKTIQPADKVRIVGVFKL